MVSSSRPAPLSLRTSLTAARFSACAPLATANRAMIGRLTYRMVFIVFLFRWNVSKRSLTERWRLSRNIIEGVTADPGKHEAMRASAVPTFPGSHQPRRGRWKLARDEVPGFVYEMRLRPERTPELVACCTVNHPCVPRGTPDVFWMAIQGLRPWLISRVPSGQQPGYRQDRTRDVSRPRRGIGGKVSPAIVCCINH